MENLRKLWNEACLAAGIPAITKDTGARLMAVLYVHGNNEYMTHCQAFLDDLDYVRKRFKVEGGEIPDVEFTRLVKYYVWELQEYEEEHKGERTSSGLFERHIPNWAKDLFMERYGIKLIN